MQISGVVIVDKIELLKSAIEKSPKQSELWCLLAEEYLSVGGVSDAMASYSEALKYCDDETRITILTGLANLSPEKNTEPEPLLTRELDDEVNDDDYQEEYDDEIPEEAESTPFRVIEGGKASEESDADSVVTFNDVGGLADIKKSIRMKIIEPFENPFLFKQFKKKSGGGILLYGPPGCGKTYLAKATAGECNAYFKPVHITDILNPYIGQSERNIKDIFDVARMHKPCVMFFDEIDSIAFSRVKLSSEHFRPVIDQFLSEIEGIDSSTDQLLIIGATNMPWDVDTAFKRPGRFDKMFFIPPPDEEARKIIFRLKLEGRPIGEIDHAHLAHITELYSGADIENVVEVASENVILDIMQSGTQRDIEMKDLLSAIEETSPSTLEWFKTISNYVKYSNQAGLYDDVEKYIKKYRKLI